ncbi:MAG: DUF2110 family protein [Candidatus Lokiarchaeota archaeon]
MPEILVLQDKIYNFDEVSDRLKIEKSYSQYLRQYIKDFPQTKIKIKKLRDFDKRFEISINGPDENFVTRILEKEIGVVKNFEEIQEGLKISKGKMVEVRKVGFGIFVDGGIVNPKTDILINLHSLRSQLANHKKVSINEILNKYDFINHFPVSIKIIEKDEVKKNLLGEIGEETLNFLHQIVNQQLEYVFINGSMKKDVEIALRRTNHSLDYTKIENYGFLEHIIQLKRGTNAIGIISDIGSLLEGSKMSALIPKRIRKLLK